MIAAYPLQWPEGWPRTKSYLQKNVRFKHDGRWITVFAACDRVLVELDRLGIKRDDIVISTNLKTRLDGMPRSDQREPDDHGAAVYWETSKGVRRVMAIDRYETVADNIAAIAATLEAMRAIDRHGGAQILDRAFTGFSALPPPAAARHWREVIGVPSTVRDMPSVRIAFRRRAAEVHPDKGGTHEAMAELNVALAAAERELNGS
ncbi:hypothetical protein [Paraburkholderia xenovorans]|jgi:hypothetical protein